MTVTTRIQSFKLRDAPWRLTCKDCRVSDRADKNKPYFLLRASGSRSGRFTRLFAGGPVVSVFLLGQWDKNECSQEICVFLEVDVIRALSSGERDDIPKTVDEMTSQ